MYDTPFISALYTVPRSLPPPGASAAEPEAVPSAPCTGADRTRSISCSGWWIPSATPTLSTRFPTKRLRSTSLSAATITPSAWLTSLSSSTFSAPMDPCVSTFISMPRPAAACASFSAAI